LSRRIIDALTTSAIPGTISGFDQAAGQAIALAISSFLIPGKSSFKLKEG
jgi:hypothetical protein